MLRQPDRTRWERLVDTPLPEWIQIQQTFPSIEEKDVTAAVRRELSRPEIRHYLRPGLSVAIGVGSRGLASLRTLVATTVAVLKVERTTSMCGFGLIRPTLSISK